MTAYPTFPVAAAPAFAAGLLSSLASRSICRWYPLSQPTEAAFHTRLGSVPESGLLVASPGSKSTPEPQFVGRLPTVEVRSNVQHTRSVAAVLREIRLRGAAQIRPDGKDDQCIDPSRNGALELAVSGVSPGHFPLLGFSR